MTDTNEETNVSDVIRLLNDNCARQIIMEALNEPVSANELSERCDVSPPTIYRRLEELSEHGLVTEQTRADPDGHHYSVYATTLKHVGISVTENGLDMEITNRETMADRFTTFIEDMT